MKKKEKISKAKSPDTSKKQKKAEEKLRYDLFFALAEQSSDIILLVNREGIVSYANPAVSILGLNAEERIGANAFEHVHPDDIKIITDSFHILFSDANAHTQRAEVRLRCMNGGWRTFEAMGSSLVHDNVVESAIVNLRDITERKRMEEKLWQEQLEIQAIMDASPIGVSWSDMQGNIKYNNCRFQELFGYTVEDMPDIATWLLLAYPSLSYREQVSSQVMLLMDAQNQGKETDPLELTITCKDGSIRQVLHKIVITHNRILAIFYDITERKRTEEKLFLISKAVESSSNAIGLSDPQGHHFYHNKAFTELFEYTPEDLEAAGGGPAVFVNKKVAHEVFDAIMSGRSWIGEVEIISKSGRKFPVNLRADAIKNEKGEIVGLIGVHTDITERKKSEEALKESEAKYRLLAEHTKDTVWVTDLNLKVNYISLSAEKLLGYTLDEIIPIPLDKLLTPATFKAAMDFYALELSKDRKSVV
jgi:two-component system NtrC family sensor kinase